jgi:hypothetical protein
MPEAINDITIKHITKLKERLAIGHGAKYSYDQLVQKMAVHVVGARIDLHVQSANSTPIPVGRTPIPVGSSERADGTRDTRKPRPQDKRCMNCDSKDHNTTEKDENNRFLCTVKCPKCECYYCPGIRGLECVVIMEEMPPNAEVLNAAGKPVPPFIYEKLSECQALRLVRGAGSLKVKSLRYNANTTSMAGGFNMR